MLSAYDRAKTADWMQKRYKLIEQEYEIKYEELCLSLNYIFKKKKLKKKIRYENILETFVKIHRLIKYFKNIRNRNLKKKFVKRAIIKCGMYKNIWRFAFKAKKIWTKTKKTRFSALKFALGPQQIRFVLHMFRSSRLTTQATVGSVLSYKWTIEKFGNYRPIRERDEGVREAERRRTKKYIKWFKEEYRYDNMRGVLVRKKLIKKQGHKTKKEKFMAQLAKRALELKKRPRTKRNKIKVDTDAIVYNKRGNPKTEPITEKHFRRRFSSWLWFLRIVAQFIKKRAYKVDRRLILHISGVRGAYTAVYDFIFKIFRKYKILYFLFRFDIRYTKQKIKKIASIKKRARKRLIRRRGVFWG